MSIRCAAALVLTAAALLAGCGDDAAETTKAPAAPSSSVKPDGEAIFTNEGCAACHTLAAIGAKGVSGPNLDELQPSAGESADQIENGGGGMPKYEGRLSRDEIEAVAQFIADNAGR